MQASLLHWVH